MFDKCRWFGHSFDPTGAEFYQMYYCVRCQREHQWHDPTRLEKAQWKIRLLIDHLKNRIQAWKHWWRCPECGHRLGKHDESVDHLPF